MEKFIKSVWIASLIACLAIIFLPSCNTYQKQLHTFKNFADDHPNELAPLCAKAFPVKDSVGATKIDSTHKANNVNYAGKIDSLQAIADQFKQRLLADTGKSNPCASVAKNYQVQVNTLSNQVQALRAAYKPCKPDTVYKTTPIYRTDEAKIAVLQNQFNVKSDSLKTTKTQLADEKETSASRLHWMLILGGVLVALGIVTVLKFIGKI